MANGKPEITHVAHILFLWNSAISKTAWHIVNAQQILVDLVHLENSWTSRSEFVWRVPGCRHRTVIREMVEHSMSMGKCFGLGDTLRSSLNIF